MRVVRTCFRVAGLGGIANDEYPRKTTTTQKLQQRLTRKVLLPGLNIAITLTALVFILGPVHAQSQPGPTGVKGDVLCDLKPTNTNIWQNGVGNGFRSGVESVVFALGAGDGVQIFGGKQSHDLALISLSYGKMVGPVEGENHWYRGNWELLGELFSGAQFSPSTESLVGITPHLRYNFATGSRWIPYADIGAGVSATSIGRPDLSGTFEFNLQAATGVRWFIRDNLALGLEVRYLHMSCAGIHPPNLGLNTVNGMLSVTWFF